MPAQSFSIVGCGSLGSALAYCVALKSLEEEIDYLFLLDKDCLYEKNLPYIVGNQTYSNLNTYIGKPKVEVLKEILNSINPKLSICTLYDNYPIEDNFLKYSYRIDCRDSGDIDPYFNMRIRIDGNFGLILMNPKQSETKDTMSRYVFGNSRLNSMILSSVCSTLIFHEYWHQHLEDSRLFLVNLSDLTGGIHELPASHSYHW
jgi:hypothetical protein